MLRADAISAGEIALAGALMRSKMSSLTAVVKPLAKPAMALSLKLPADSDQPSEPAILRGANANQLAQLIQIQHVVNLYH
jgi:hypothetical protein